MKKQQQNGYGAYSFNSKIKKRPLFKQRGYGYIQKGHGLGSLFRAIFKVAKPLIRSGIKLAKPLIRSGVKLAKPNIKKVGKYAIKEMSRTGADILNDKLKKRKLKTSIKKRVGQTKNRIINTSTKKLLEHLKKYK